MEEKKTLGQKYRVGLFVISIAIIAGVVLYFTMFPEGGLALGRTLMHFLTYTFGSSMQFLTVLILIFLIGISFSKYGSIRMGNKKPKYRTISWVAMMFFCGNGAGTVYWAFLEWGYHFNAAPQLRGVAISEPYAYELSMAYTFFDWGPSAWALLCVFVLPFAYHYHVKKDNNLRYSELCKYSMGEKAVRGWFGQVVDFIFIFAAIGSIAITAGASASTISSALAKLVGINNSFTLSMGILLFVALLYGLSSFLGIEKGMKRLADNAIYFCMALLLLIFFSGYTQQILDSIVNALGLLGDNYIRMSLWTDPIARTGYPQDWTAFYLVYWMVFGPFTGLFVAKISEGRRIREIVANMLITGSAGLVMFFGIVGGFQQGLRKDGIMDVPAMLANGQSEDIAMTTLSNMPLPTISLVVYLVVIVLFLATTLDACAFTLASTVSKDLKSGEEPNKFLKLVWCLVLVGIPIAIAFIGTDIATIKGLVMITGLPLLLTLVVIYHGYLRELVRDYGSKSKEEILKEGDIRYLPTAE